MAARFMVRLTARGGRDEVERVGPSGELRARVRAAPQAGAANDALCRLIADALKMPSGAVTIDTGQRGRTKRLRVSGLSAEDVARQWPGLAVVDAPDRAAG